MGLLNLDYMKFFTPLCYAACLLLLLPATGGAQITIGQPEEGNLSNGDNSFIFGAPGVRNRSRSKGVEMRYEREGGFDWAGRQGVFGESSRRVELLEQFTFKFKVPLVNQPDVKVLLGYEWESEKYYFEDREDNPNDIWAYLDERRLKNNKLSAYFTKSWDDRYYTTARLRMSSNGDYKGLWDFDHQFRTYSAAFAFGKKISDNKEWAAGFTLSSNQARFVAVPFFVYNITWNDNWGLETALPGQFYLRRNTGADQQNAFLLGATFDSKFYALHTGPDTGEFEDLGSFYLRYSGIRATLHYEHRIVPWVYAYGQAGYYIPINARFNPFENVDQDLFTDVQGRPILRVRHLPLPAQRAD